MSGDRSWMYARLKNGLLNPDFLNGLEEFIAFACSQPYWMDGPKIRCPCNLHKCQNKAYRDVETVKVHLCRKGFVPGYEVWNCHGEIEETMDERSNEANEAGDESFVNFNAYEEMAGSGDIPIEQMDEMKRSITAQVRKEFDEHTAEFRQQLADLKPQQVEDRRRESEERRIRDEQIP